MSNPITEFWAAFEALHARLIAEAGALGATYDALLQKVQVIDPGLSLEMCVDADPKEFIITAEGERTLFPLVESIVQAAPPIPGWKVLALKPNLGFPVTIEWEGYLLTIADVLFKPLPLDDGKLGLTLYVPGLRPEDADSAHNALLRALDHGLGERAFAEQIYGTTVEKKPGWLGSAGLLKLTDLEGYLQNRK